MGSVVDLRMKPPDDGITLLHIEFKGMAIECNSLGE